MTDILCNTPDGRGQWVTSGDRTIDVQLGLAILVAGILAGRPQGQGWEELVIKGACELWDALREPATRRASGGPR